MAETFSRIGKFRKIRVKKKKRCQNEISRARRVITHMLGATDKYLLVLAMIPLRLSPGWPFRCGLCNFYMQFFFYFYFFFIFPAFKINNLSFSVFLYCKWVSRWTRLGRNINLRIMNMEMKFEMVKIFLLRKMWRF